MSFIKKISIIVTVFIVTIISNTSDMSLINKANYEFKKHLYIENIYYKFRSDIFSILNIDYQVSGEVIENDITVYKLEDKLLIESDSELVLNYQSGHVYNIDIPNLSVRVSIDKDNIIEYRELSTISIKLYDSVEVGDIIGTSKYDSYKSKYYYEVHILKGDIDYIYEIML